MTMQRLPRTLAPKSTMPSILEISAASLGRRASNNSATRGRPPVMSLVLDVLRGVLAMSVPATILSPSFDHDVRAGRNRIIRQRLRPCRRTMMICGCKSSLCSMTTMRLLPGRLVHFLFHRHALDDVVELHRARPSRRESGRCTDPTARKSRPSSPGRRRRRR